MSSQNIVKRVHNIHALDSKHHFFTQCRIHAEGERMKRKSRDSNYKSCPMSDKKLKLVNKYD